MIDKTMTCQLLAAPFINRNFVQGESMCNYEIYLLELLNKSEWFGKNYFGGFSSPESQSNGECDAINKNYSIDFKLFITESAMKARNLYSRTQYNISGIIFTGVGKRTGTAKYVKTHTAFRGKTLEELEKIENGVVFERDIDHEIRAILKILQTRKNLLLFFPYIFDFVEPHDFDDAIKSISDGMREDFNSAMEYREKYAENFDTFLICIYDNKFLIFKCTSDEFCFLDRVNARDINSFMHLCQYLDFDTL